MHICIRPLGALLLLTLLSFLVLAGPARADDTAVPKGLAPSDWSSIRAAYEAGRHAAFADDANPGHYRARNPGQQWITKFDGRGFTMIPNAAADGKGWTWGLDLISYGRSDAQHAISGTAKVQTSGTRVEYVWSDALTEWYINDQRGFEHGYTLNRRPEGANGPAGMLHLTLGVRGDLLPRVSENGRDVAFQTAEGGAALTYNNLRVFDADGVHLAASFRVVTSNNCTPSLLLTVDDTNARYPLTIDPTAQQAYLKAFATPLTSAGAFDSFGYSVSVSGDTVVVGAIGEASNATGVNGNGANNSAVGSGAAYVFVRTGTTWTLQAYLKASNTQANDNFGFSVSVSGDTVVVGAPSEDSNATGVNGNQADNSASGSGAAYVFIRTGTTWTQQAYLKASNTEGADSFGLTVSASGDTVVVGAYFEDSNATGVNGNQADNSASGSGAAYVFFRSGTTWTQQAYLKASNMGAGDNFGDSVAVSGDTVVVGAIGEDSNATGVNGNQANNSAVASGAAYVFIRTGTAWTQQAYLKASNTGTSDNFGYSVAVSGDTVVVGAIGEDSNATGVNGNESDNTATDAGAAYVFFRTGSTWTQQAYIKPSNTQASDNFGISVAISGDTVVVGADLEDGNATGVNGNQADNSLSGSGAAYVFVRSGTTWSQQAYLKASNTGAFDRFGTSVGVSGDTVVVGARLEDSNGTTNGNQADNTAGDAGAAYVFFRSGSTWTQQAYLKASNAPIVNAGDSFGYSVAVSGDTAVVGAPFEDSNATGVNGNAADDSVTASGAAYVFVRSGTTWTQQAFLKASNTGADDWFGSAIAVSGDTVVVGARFEDSNATGVNGNGADNSASNAGAAYVFVRTGTTWTQQAYLKASITGAFDQFGYSVAVSGDTILVGAYGEDSNATGVNGNQFNNSASESGAAYVFVRLGITWGQQAYLKASNTEVNDNFGISVAISGDTAVVGAYGESSNATGVNGNQSNNGAPAAGAAYVFVRSGTTWTQQEYLKASNTGSSDQFGTSVGVSGDTVVVGASREDSNATGVNGDQDDNSASMAGAAYVFVRAGSTWSQQAYLKASNTEAIDQFGSAVAVAGETIVVGAAFEAGTAGAAYVFVRSGSMWSQQAYLKASNAEAVDQFGYSVAVSGDTVVVGAAYEASNATGVNGSQTNNSAVDAGAAYVFVLGLPTPISPLATPSTVCSGDTAALSVTNPGAGIVIDWFTGSCGGVLIGTGNPFNVSPSATTTYFARSRRLSDGNTSDACASVVVTVNPCRCQPADIACDDGTPLPPLGPGNCDNSGVNEGDYNAFFQGFFDASPQCDIACDDGTPLPPFGAGGCDNTGINEGDYNCFFQFFFNGCP